MRPVRVVLAVVAASVLLLTFTLASARPGGGSSFSRGSGSSSSGGSRSFGGSTSSSSSGGSRSWGGSTSSTSSSSGGSRSWGGSTSTSSSSSSGWSTTSSTSSGSYGSTSGSYGSTSGSYSSSGYSTPVTTSSSGSYSGSGYSSPPPSDRSMMRSLFIVFAIAAVVILLLVLYWRRRERSQNADWEARMAADAEEAVRNTRHANIKAALEAIRSEDDAFSYVLFEDFLYALYGEAHAARGKGTIEQLAHYFGPEARARLKGFSGADAPKEVSTIVIGGMRVESIETEGARVLLDVVFTSNMTETNAAGAQQAYYVEERWKLVRDAKAKSREPERARTIGCPNCGAPLDKTVAATCGYCGVASKPGEQDWFVEDIEIGSHEPRAPMLTGTTEEVGTDWPTVVAPDARSELEALRTRDPAFVWPAFVQRVERVFHAFHTSWSAQDLKAVRPYLSDNLFELQQYWIRAYKSQGLKNLTENPTIVTVHLARITRDKFFEAVTVRVFASCVDYTVDKDGKVVGGDKSKTREYSEYWTFIRGVGKTGAPRADGNCPSCGAPLADVNMAGNCGHCNAKVTSGEFDWVLSRIEQDEVYDAAA